MDDLALQFEDDLRMKVKAAAISHHLKPSPISVPLAETTTLDRGNQPAGSVLLGRCNQLYHQDSCDAGGGRHAATQNCFD